MQSQYIWEGKTAKDSEFLMLFKAKKADYEELEKTICAAHNYNTAEVIMVTIERGAPGYLSWISEVTR
jgi:periplasmic divalent cation tolerance protein